MHLKPFKSRFTNKSKNMTEGYFKNPEFWHQKRVLRHSVHTSSSDVCGFLITQTNVAWNKEKLLHFDFFSSELEARKFA